MRRFRSAVGTHGSGFTLIELLVVVAIIVVLLAVLIPGLQKAMQAAERSQCGTNQRGIAQGAAQYALEFDRTFPPFRTLANGVPNTAMVVRNNIGANQAEAAQKNAVVGVGHLIAQGRVGGLSQGGKAVHCPSLDTSSATPVNVGMDLSAGSNDGAGGAIGASFFNLAGVVTSGYIYRGKSYGWTHSNGDIRTNIAKQTFAITMDTVTYRGDAANNKSGRTFHHLTGWNVSFGDGHVSYIQDPEGPFKGTGVWSAGVAWTGKVEREIAKGRNIHGGNGADPAAAEPKLDAQATEDVFNWFGTAGGG